MLFANQYFVQGRYRLKKGNFLWSFFSSVKLTLVLLFLIVVFFIIATVFSGQDISSEPDWLADIHHSKVFYLLLSLFSLNLLVCSINRLPLTIKRYRADCFPDPSGIFENTSENRIIVSSKNPEDAERVAQSILSSQFVEVKRKDTEQGSLLCHEQGRFSLWGVYMVHLGVLIILAGAVIGNVWGFKGEMKLPETAESNIVHLVKRGGIHQLDFSVRCDQFMMEFYDNGAPKSYRSEISFIKNDHVERRVSLEVNHPATFEGIRFYQASYSLSEERRAVLTYRRTGNDNVWKIAVRRGETFDLPLQNARATVLRVEENMMQLGPAVKLRVDAGEKSIQFWVFQHIREIAEVNPGLLKEVPLFNPGLFKPLIFSLERIDQTYVTGLQVSRDPGVPVVFIGGVMLLAGILVVFFFSHQQIWVRIQPLPEGTRICVAGRSNRYQESFNRRLDTVADRIRGRVSS